MSEATTFTSLRKTLWLAARKDLALGLPWVPLYSLAEISLAFAISALVQLVFVDTPRVAVSQLVPPEVQSFLRFGQTLDRKDLAFAVPLIVIVIGFVRMISSFCSSYFIERAGHQVAHSLRHHMLEGFLNANGNVLDSKNTDEAANQLMMDTSLLQSVISKGTISALRDGCVILGVLAAMFILAFKTMLIGAVVILPFVFFLRSASAALNFYAKESAVRQVALATRALQTRNGLLTVFALRSQARELTDFKRLAEGFYQFIRRSFLLRTAFRPGTELLLLLGLAWALHWRLSQTADFNVATYSALFLLVGMAFRPLKNVASLVAQWTEIRVVSKRVAEQWDSYWSRPAHGDKGRLESLPAHSADALVAGQIEYIAEGGTLLLKDCNLNVPRGSKVALIGPSGAGKTTFLRVAGGLLAPSEGSIKIEPAFLLATQLPYVFKGTVKENIIYATPVSHLPESVIDDACLELVQSLSLAHSQAGSALFLQKKVGYQGDGLSGGERARVALARSLFARPKLLLLDEPTANLDATSAQQFWSAVDAWKAKDPRHTVVAVSHALHEVAHWDLCYVFEAGRVVRVGRPQEVIHDGRPQ